MFRSFHFFDPFLGKTCRKSPVSFALGKRFAVAKLTASLSARAKLRPRLLVASGRLIPSPEIQVSTGKDLLIPRGRAGLEASYLLPISPPSFSWVSLRFLDRLLPNAVPPAETS
ncbi:hypothetical protein KY290_011450 [Solanum tuberosum]|uniref:Uncharacterized protein n=1 Tax=Solanum tuberosum TaxID=4113 RepID=A0ABQ7W2P2_SOLTU|nr:hypothetical protein KY290_011450 [Solanum tuberosum]